METADWGDDKNRIIVTIPNTVTISLVLLDYNYSTMSI